MKLQDQVCLLDQSKRLKELGVVQESHCHWVSSSTMLPEGYHLTVQGVSPFKDTSRFKDSYSAFTVAELGVMLPDPWSVGKHFGSRGIKLGSQGEYYQFDILEYSYYGLTMAECMGNALSDLLETGQLTVEEVNRRLVK
jgi:hypothetical protein